VEMDRMRNASRQVTAWGILLLVAMLSTGCQRAQIGGAKVDAARLTNADAEPGAWMSHGRTYSEQRFSPLDAINTVNVADLGLAWFADLDTNRGQEATPIVVDGVIYISTAWSKVK